MSHFHHLSLRSFFDRQAVNMAFSLLVDQFVSGAVHDHHNMFHNLGIPGQNFQNIIYTQVIQCIFELKQAHGPCDSAKIHF